MSMRFPRTLLLTITVAASLAACQSGEAPDSAAAPASTEAATDTAGDTPVPATASPEVADAMESGMDAMVKLGGAMQAAAEICNHAGPAELDASRQQQRQMFVQQGGTEARFDSVFGKGYDDARAKLDGVSAEKREQACRELVDMSNASVGQ